MPLFYDAIIALVAAAVPLYLGERRLRGKGFGFFGVALAAAWLIVMYGSFIAPRMLYVRRESVTIGDGERTLRIAVISDMHFGFYRHAEWAERLTAETNALKPDVVVLAGDLVSTMSGTAAFKPFRGLHARLGTYAVLGNWDYGVGAVDVRKAIESTGAEVLTNEAATLDIDGQKVALIGIDDVRYGHPDWDAAFSGALQDVKKIVLVHNPDGAGPAEVRGADLMIAGHTHCGQVRLPLIGSLAPLPTSIDNKFDCGLFSYGRLPFFITAGAGESGPRARLFDPPEIALLEVRF